MRLALRPEDMDGQLLSSTYDSHAAAIYGVLLQVFRCEHCANGVLAYTILKVCSEGDPTPLFQQTLRTAFSCAGSAPGVTGEEMKANIRLWYLEARALHGISEKQPLAAV
ncbi:MAG: hypothetical protein ACOH13_15585 [Flavobacteriales bacterium]